MKRLFTMMTTMTAAGALLLCGCSGGMVTNTISPSPTPNVTFIPSENTVNIAGIRTVAIFPFADYSMQQDQLGANAWGGNIKIIEAITDQVIAHGLTVTVQEDVNTALVDEQVIRPIDPDKYLIYGTDETIDDAVGKLGTPEHELANYEHSEDMTEEIVKIIKRENRKKKPSQKKSPVLQGATVGLSRDRVVRIAENLGADLVIRGRIIDYGFRDVGTLNPLYRGFIPVAIDGVKDLMFGVSGSYGYEDDLEDIESILMGAALGAVIGNNIISGSTSTHTSYTSGLFVRETTTKHRSHDDYAVEGAAAGAAAGWLAAQHPKKAKRSAVVQVRLYAQDGRTGEMLWSNRVEMEYTPKSNFAYADTHPKTMFDKAVDEGIKVLMDSFFSEAAQVFTDDSPALPQAGA